MNQRAAFTRRGAHAAERGLTLIEIIVVLIILSVLMAFLLGRVFTMGDTAKAETTRVKMTDLKSGIYLYQMRNNTLPQNLEQAGISKDQLTDAWGQPIQYRALDNGRAYELRSVGADGKEGGEGVDADISVKGP